MYVQIFSHQDKKSGGHNYYFITQCLIAPKKIIQMCSAINGAGELWVSFCLYRTSQGKWIKTTFLTTSVDKWLTSLYLVANYLFSFFILHFLSDGIQTLLTSILAWLVIFLVFRHKQYFHALWLKLRRQENVFIYLCVTWYFAACASFHRAFAYF